MKDCIIYDRLRETGYNNILKGHSTKFYILVIIFNFHYYLLLIFNILLISLNFHYYVNYLKNSERPKTPGRNFRVRKFRLPYEIALLIQSEP